MSLKLSHICLLTILIVSVSSFYIKPLRAGTVFFFDIQIRLNKVFSKIVDLNLAKADYQAHKDINVIASMTSLSMDNQLNFHIGYVIICPDDKCLLNFTFTRYTEKVNLNFYYRISLDYLVARGLKVFDLNMTSFQQHIEMSHVPSYDQNNNKQNIGAKIPFNNEDAWNMLMFPTGFNNLTHTGHITYNYELNTIMYVVHYMDHSGIQKVNQGWAEQQDYVRYRVAFFPPSYLQEKSCTPLQKFKLSQHFEHRCEGGSKTKWFVGFQGTKETQFEGQLFEQLAGFSYSLSKTPSKYGLFAFPFETTDEFIDLREHQYKWNVEYHLIGVYLGYIILTFAIVLVLFGCYVFFKPFFKYTQSKKMFKKVEYETAREQYDTSAQN